MLAEGKINSGHDIVGRLHLCNRGVTLVATFASRPFDGNCRRRAWSLLRLHVQACFLSYTDRLSCFTSIAKRAAERFGRPGIAAKPAGPLCPLLSMARGQVLKPSTSFRHVAFSTIRPCPVCHGYAAQPLSDSGCANGQQELPQFVTKLCHKCFAIVA